MPVQWVIAEVSLSACETVREQGQVFNYRDWPLQNAFWVKVQVPGSSYGFTDFYLIFN